MHGIIYGEPQAVAHLAPFGIVYIAGAWTLLPLPALLRVVAMFLSSLVF